jgi:hypothetical protein
MGRLACKLLNAQPEGNRILGRSRRRCGDTSKKKLREIVLEVADSCVHGNERSGFVKGGKFLD